MSSDAESFLCNYLQTTHFSIQLESTLPDNAALLLAYVRFIMNQEIYEELLFARTLITDTKDFESRFEDILTMVIPPWIINPYGDIEETNVIIQEELTELSADNCLITESAYAGAVVNVQDVRAPLPDTAVASSNHPAEDPIEVGFNFVQTDPSVVLLDTPHDITNTEGNFSDDSDIDPIYVPEETTDSDSSIVPFIPHETKNRIQVPKKRKITPKERKGRKRVKNTNEWIDVRAKKELNLGIEHKNRKGKIIPAKQIKNPCKENCRNKCRQKISEEERKALFEEFWKIGDHSRQWDYIVRYVKTVEKKHVKRTDSKSRRNHSRTYQLLVNNKEITVCKTMFLNTYGISEQWVTTALGKIGETGTLEEDRRGKHLTRPNKIDGGVLNGIREHIQLFPVVPSHYTRKKSTKMYLEDGLNISIMHRLYLKYMEQRNATEVGTLRQYREVINAEFNLAFHKPKKDQCSLCVAYQLATSPDKQKIQEKYEKHVSNKKAARALKDEDKETAINDKTISAACFDLQKVLVTPQSAVSDFYYKTNISGDETLEKRAY
ncbi:unnamed protein product [Acanthoscelides obtectus]|uniref:Uncharacterized protein n=1 Tax=Acanthoscelides obtectus TaxID=200917 RepID=A0A9P0KKT6_ACAOB|nr:unnamed protein product [Acanthoscelides obtectus]CAK1626200.1 hypothetical protein AOBTE_LOCUS3675 [Acanthoscelides obtectus]